MLRIRSVIDKIAMTTEEFLGADCPKTENQILKVGAEYHNLRILKSEVEIDKGIKGIQDTEMENDGRSETVFGQSVGGMDDEACLSEKCFAIILS